MVTIALNQIINIDPMTYNYTGTLVQELAIYGTAYKISILIKYPR